MKTCLQCPKTLRSDYKLDVCQKCLSVCECGTAKDWRAVQCRSCASRLGTTKQWETMRPTMLKQIEQSSVKRRRKFADLEWQHFRERKNDGRMFARYWDEDSNYRAIYRYQWVWRKANGEIPAGHHIHHKDNDPTNDALENLEALSETEHHRLHGLEMTERGAKWVCQKCGKEFYRSPRGETRIRKYCSQKCHYDQIRGMPIKRRQDIKAQRLQ